MSTNLHKGQGSGTWDMINVTDACYVCYVGLLHNSKIHNAKKDHDDDVSPPLPNFFSIIRSIIRLHNSSRCIQY